MGTGVRLTSSNAPEVYTAFEQAKEVLDFDASVDLYCYRAYGSAFHAYGTDRYFIGIPDSTIRMFTPIQWQFLFGQCITALKGKMTEMLSLANAIESATHLLPLDTGKVLVAPLGQWKRKAQLTLDRGGLLACQYYDEVMRYLNWVSGVPSRDLDSIDVYDRVEEIVQSTKENKGFADTIGHVKNTVFSTRNMYSRERFLELYNWYESGMYAKIVREHT